METESHARANAVSITAIVLAGGRSSRMGQDKALLPIQGVPLLQLVCSIASALGDPVYVVTPWPERYQHLLPATCQFIREVPLPGESTGDVTSASIVMPLPHGPLVGFAQGLAQVQTDWVLLLACDLPRLRVDVLQDWAAELESLSEEALAEGGAKPIALLPRRAKGWEPLCGFYRRTCLPALTDFINQGGRSFQQWLGQHSVQLLPLLEDDQMLFNCNTPTDLNAMNRVSKNRI